MSVRMCALLLGTAIGSIMANPTWAQDAPASSAAQASADNSAGGMGEIIVTAQKREQSINKVGAPIIAISGEGLKDKNVVSLADLAATIPGLNYSTTGYGTPVFTLRGVGFTDATLASYPDVSVYIDQVPLPFPVLTKNSNFDLERVEVLEGPQGTLFGSNATGGAINYIAAKPTKDLQGGLSLTYGRFNDLIADGYVSGPLSDTLRFRLAGRVEHRDDWQYSYTRKDSNGQISTAAGRLLLDWDASDRLNFQLNLTGWRDRSDPQQSQLYKLSLQAAPQFADPKLLAYPLAPFDPRAADWNSSFPVYGDSWFLQSTLRAGYAVTDSINLTSLTGFIRAKYDVFAQASGANVAVSIYAPYGKFHDFFQEFRVDNGASGRLRWTLGLNYQQDDVNESVYANFSQSTAHGRLGINQDKDFNNQRTKNYAAFASAEFDILNNVTAKGGVRYTRSIRDDTSCAIDAGDGSTAAFFTNLERALNPGKTIPALGVDDCYPINPATNLSERFFGKIDEDNVSYRFGLDWKVSQALLVYANVSKGYKAGGFPTVTASAFPEYAPVSQESLVDYEAGFKLSLFDRLLFLTGNGFYYDYRNKQLRSKIITPVFGTLNATVNIPKSSVKGAEVTLSSRPIYGFTPTFSATYLDATIDQFSGVNAGGQVADFSNTRMPLAPKFSANGDLQYEARLGQRVSGFVGASITYRSKTNALVGSPAEYDIPAYTLLDVRAGISVDDGAWKILVFGKNITNKYYVDNVVRQYDVVVRFAGQPATYGVTVSHRF